MKKMIKTIALAATCAIAGTGCVSLGAAQKESEGSWSLKKQIDLLYEPMNLAKINLSFGVILAIMQWRDTKNKNRKEHAAMTLGLSAIPLLAELTHYKIPSAIPIKPQPLSTLFTILGMACGPTEEIDKSTGLLKKSGTKAFYDFCSNLVLLYENTGVGIYKTYKMLYPDTLQTPNTESSWFGKLTNTITSYIPAPVILNFAFGGIFWPKNPTKDLPPEKQDPKQDSNIQKLLDLDKETPEVKSYEQQISR